MRMIMTATAALGLASCGGGTPEATPAPVSAPVSGHGAIDAPVPDGVATRITVESDGGTVEARVGALIAVVLKGVPTAGYIWGVAEAPSFLEAAGEMSGPTSTAQLEPGFTGGDHWEVLVFAVKAEGSGVLRLEQRRPWEDNAEPANGAFSVTINAVAPQ